MPTFKPVRTAIWDEESLPPRHQDTKGKRNFFVLPSVLVANPIPISFRGWCGVTREPLLLVDGYNVLHAWPALMREAGGNLEAARQRLADRIAEYEATRGMRATLIFDGSGKGRSASEGMYAVETRFSSQGLSADHVIERSIVEWRERTDDYLPITVVTSDRMIHNLAMRERAVIIGSREFITELDAIRTETARYGSTTPFRVSAADAARAHPVRPNRPRKPPAR